MIEALVQSDFVRAVMRGGPVMLALALVSLLLYRNVFVTLVTVQRIRLPRLAESRKDAGVAPREVPARLPGSDRTLKSYRAWLKDRQRTAGMLIAASPLLGLLGTVMGMLNTFESLATRAGQQTADQVADGVSMALITTQTGLTIAIPALFMLYWIQRISARREAEYYDFLGKEEPA